MGKTFKDQRKYERRAVGRKASDDPPRRTRGRPRVDELEEWDEDEALEQYYYLEELEAEEADV